MDPLVPPLQGERSETLLFTTPCFLSLLCTFLLALSSGDKGFLLLPDGTESQVSLSLTGMRFGDSRGKAEAIVVGAVELLVTDAGGPMLLAMT